ncbi:MAG: hypothetical protein ACT452_07110 [Microthrixaceae bacterium]
MTTRNPSLAHRLVARAFVLALDPALSVAERGAHLALLAVRSPASLELAIRGIEVGPHRASERGAQAVVALRAAIGLVTAERRPLQVAHLGRVS